MPFFSKSITDLSTDDLQELLDDSAVENVRLEFKQEIPGPDETLKKLSSFANTFGGYLVVGAAASSSDGRLESLPGVDPQRNYRQTIIQRCYEGVWPPIEVFVSDGIPAPNVADKVCYVIHVPESMEAPHFLTKRRGAYVRTDEFSQRFEPRLAEYEEIQHLANRRRLAVERREELFSRAVSRFEILATGEYASYPRTSGSIGATLCLCVCPEFPVRQLMEPHALRSLVDSLKVSWRDGIFPYGLETITQQDSVIVLHPISNFSTVELNGWGQVSYFFEIEYLLNKESSKVPSIHLNALLGHILVSLAHSGKFYRNLGFNGSLLLRTLMMRVRGKAFTHYPHGNVAFTGPASRIDDEITIDISIPATRLIEHRNGVAADLFKLLFFSLNWAGAASDEAAVADLLNGAAKFNHWPESS